MSSLYQRGKDLDNTKAATEARGLNEFNFDYCFPGDEFGFKMTFLVGRERTLGMTMATVMPMKGPTGKFVVDKVRGGQSAWTSATAEQKTL